MGGVELPIFYTAMSRYAGDLGISGEARERFLRFVSEIDNAYLETQRKAAEKPSSENPPKVNANA